MIFKHWKYLDQSPAGFIFDKEFIYYIHARAWALKGWLGGTHSWFVFWSDNYNTWVTVELSDKETLDVQGAKIYWIRENISYTEHSPIISNRTPDAKWFGANPIILGSVKKNFSDNDVIKCCEKYPLEKFKLLTQNCNTFSSYLIHSLNLKIKRPLRSIGYKNKRFWNAIC